MTPNNRLVSDDQLGGFGRKTVNLIMEYGQIWIFVLVALILHAGIITVFVG